MEPLTSALCPYALNEERARRVRDAVAETLEENFSPNKSSHQQNRRLLCCCERIPGLGRYFLTYCGTVLLSECWGVGALGRCTANDTSAAWR